MRFAWLLFAVAAIVVGASGRGRADEYRLQPGDMVEIWVAQQASLNRTAAISPDGRIAFPLAGHLAAEGLTVEELEASLTKRLQSFFKDQLDLTVMLQPSPQHLPTIFVVGDVNTPGAYPYRPNMTVLHALSVAGGFFRTAMLPGDRDRAIIVGGQMADARKRLAQLEASKARIKAELDDKDRLEIEADVSLDVPKSLADEMLAREQQLLDRHREEVAVQIDAKKHVSDLMERGLTAVREQSETIQRRIDLAKQRLQSTSILVNKGLANVSQRIDVESSIAELQGMLNQLQSTEASTEGALASETSRLDVLLQERRTRLVTEFQDADRQAENLHANLASNQRVMSIYAGATASSPKVSYGIVRSAAGGTRETDAAESTPLQPGDLVRVTVARPDADQAQSIDAQQAPALDGAPLTTTENSQ